MEKIRNDEFEDFIKKMSLLICWNLDKVKIKYNMQAMFSGPELVFLATVGSLTCRVLFRIIGKCIFIFKFFP